MLAIVNTALGTSAAGISTLLSNRLGIIPGTGQNYSLLTTINGSLTGTVALCAGCDVYELWASVAVGALAGPIFLVGKWLLLRYRVDDPLDAIPVHGGGGVLGAVAVHIFR
jgi:Amt family ammonium transporter